MNITRLCEQPSWPIRRKRLPAVAVHFHAQRNLETGGFQTEIQAPSTGEQ